MKDEKDRIQTLLIIIIITISVFSCGFVMAYKVEIEKCQETINCLSSGEGQYAYYYDNCTVSEWKCTDNPEKKDEILCLSG